MGKMLRVTLRSGEVLVLARPDWNDEIGWLQVYHALGNAKTIEENPE